MKEPIDPKDLLEDSKVFCIAPWTHLHVLTTGKVFPCCVSGHDASNAVGDLQAGDTLQSAWNSPTMRALRRNMLAGKSSKLCERCYVNEDLNIESFRKTENQQMAHHVQWVEQTNENGSLDTLHLPYLDLRVSNLCNLKCRICCHKYSTAWYEDSARLGLVAPDGPRQIEAVDDPDLLWEQLQPLIPSLEHVHFAGGEPLIMAEHYRLVDELIKLGRTDVRISYNTNFLVMRYKHFDAMSMWKAFPIVYVSASLDGMGARGDYMRKGQHWDRIEENRERLRRECPHVDFQVSATVSLMNALHMPAFFRDWHEKGFVRPDRMKMYLLFEPDHYSVQGLPKDLKRRVEDEYGEFIATYLAPMGQEAAELIDNFNAIVTHMNEQDLDVASEFRRVTVELDVLRGESFAHTFPELAAFAAPTLVERARARRKLGDVAGSVQDYDDAIRLDPRDAHAYAERGSLRDSADSDAALADFNTALQLDPDLLDARLNRGVRLRERGEHTAALQDLDAVLDRMNDKTRQGDQGMQAFIERGRIRRQCGDCTGALADFNQAFTLVSQVDLIVPDLRARYGLLVDRAEVKRALGDKDGELQDYNEAILRNPDQIWAIIGRARVRRENADLTNALADYTRALALAPASALIAPGNAPGIIGTLLRERAEVQRALGHNADALHDYDGALLQNPDDVWAVIGRGRTRRQCSDLPEALIDFNQAIVLVSLVADMQAKYGLLVDRAEIKGALGDRDGELQDYDEAIRDNPDQLLAIVGRARLRRKNGELSHALSDYARALALVTQPAPIEPESAPASPAALLLERAEVRQALGDKAGAMQDYNDALLTNPDEVGAVIARGRLKREGGALADAVADHTRALELLSDSALVEPDLVPSIMAGLLIERAEVKTALGDKTEALADYDEAIVRNPGNIWAFVGRARLRAAGGTLADAAADYASALSLVPHSTMVEPADIGAVTAALLVERGDVRRALGDTRGALQDCDDAILHNAEDARAYLGQARARQKLGDLAGATAAYDHALALTPPLSYLPLILSERGVVKQEMGDYVGSWRDVTQAVGLAPDSLNYINQHIAAIDKHVPSTRGGSRGTLDLAHPTMPAMLYYARGVIRRRLGDWDLAMLDFTRALELLPEENPPLQDLIDQMRRPDVDALSSFAESER